MLLPTRIPLAAAALLCALACRAAAPLTVQLDWIPNAQFAGVLVAKEKGWYAAEGLDVSVRAIDLSTMPSAVEPVLAAPNVIGVADGLVLLRARAAHQPIKAFATMLQASPLCILTLRDGPIKAFRDLKGRTIGLHSYDHPQLELMLAFNGLAKEDVHTVDIGDDLTSLGAGKIDAQVAYAIDEKVGIELGGHPTRTFQGRDNGFVTYSQVYFAPEALVRGRPEVLAAFLRATNRGWREAFSRPRACAEMIVARYLPKDDVTYQEKSLGELEKYAKAESDHLGEMRPATWERSCEVFKLPKSAATDLVDGSILARIH